MRRVGKERAARVLAYVRESESLGTLATSLVEDNVSFQLLDGMTTSNLPTFQQVSVAPSCPLILEHADRVLIIDQPEDHIDNAFIVDTLIKSILRRSTSSQLIVSTHNANIPALWGSAIGHSPWVRW